MAATDFFTVEVWTPRGLVTIYVLFIIPLSTRSVHIAGVTTAPNGAYMKQVARNLTDVGDGFLLNSRYLIMDRDTKYMNDFRGHLDREGVKPVRCPARAPNCNAFAERFVRSIKDECLGRMLLFGEASLRRALRAYVVHYNERTHQGKMCCGRTPMQTLEDGKKSGRRSTWLELELTVATIKPVTVRSNLNYYK